MTWGELLDALQRVQAASSNLFAIGDKYRHPYPDRVERAEHEAQAASEKLSSLAQRLGVSTGDAASMVERLRRTEVRV